MLLMRAKNRKKGVITPQDVMTIPINTDLIKTERAF